MAKDIKFKVGDEDKMELYRKYIKVMLDEGYTPEYIGGELALITHALFTANPD